MKATPPPDRPSRLKLFIRRQKRLLRPLGGLVFLGGLAAGGWYALKMPAVQEQISPLRDRLMGTNTLRVTAINIAGANLTDESAILQALNTRVGAPILNFSVSSARERLNALPFVDHASVSRHLSGEIEVTLVERPPYAVWQHHGHFELIDRQGKPVPGQDGSTKDAAAFTHLPLVVGEGANVAASGLIDTLLQEPEVRSRVTAAVRVSDRRWNLSLRDGATVLLPESEEAPAIHRLALFQASTRLLDRPVVLIDMRLPDRLTIRELPPAAPAETPSPQTSGSSRGAQPSPSAH
ncbi:cell division protein FtsQ/DivIB [Acetobacter suratthaniensis]|uniref:Cell division protein FtsQ n=1 Tax=Acetobacter suratthaniensis TaxID=1502841 RepID=A0ABS3LN91_9PROT|nr:cell division protein FtsQ/DivIB [Acetobacter suratthaniensis]MBO1328811.1 cell division protein FtsQ/DivIB [Acetobacter suratthaniensis]MCX2565802.1 cell division protein FtsQ/DivIB [Acetobacter suratthaniensis]